MIVNSIYLNYSLFYMEYFIVISVIYLFITYLLVTVNISSILIGKAVIDCSCLLLLLSNYLTINESLVFTIDLDSIVCIGFNVILAFDYLGTAFKIIIIFLSFTFFLIISTMLVNYNITRFELLLFMFFNILGLIFLCSSYNMILIFLSLELVGFSSYFLIAFKKNYCYSIECSLKYLVISSISGSFFLTGTLLLYYNLGSLSIRDINLLIFNTDTLYLTNNVLTKSLVFKTEWLYYCFKSINLNHLFFEYLLVNQHFPINVKPIVQLSFVLVLLSILIKLAVSPFHLWALEIYEKSTSIVAFFFILLNKLSYFVILFRIYCFSLNQYNFTLSSLISLGAILSIVIGSFSNLRQRKMKTLIIYSSISHLGYILLAFNIRSFFSTEVAYFYLFNYLSSNIVMWFIILILIKKQANYVKKLSKNITDLILLNKTNKIATLGLLVTLFSISGLPPFIGFFSKLGILLVLVSEGLVTLTLVILLSTVVSVFYYIRLIKILYSENLRVGKLYFPLHPFNCIMFSFFSFMLVFLFINPRLLYLFIHRIVLN